MYIGEVCVCELKSSAGQKQDTSGLSPNKMGNKMALIFCVAVIGKDGVSARNLNVEVCTFRFTFVRDCKDWPESQENK